jgi:hypothetical protein
MVFRRGGGAPLRKSVPIRTREIIGARQVRLDAVNQVPGALDLDLYFLLHCVAGVVKASRQPGTGR